MNSLYRGLARITQFASNTRAEPPSPGSPAAAGSPPSPPRGRGLWSRLFSRWLHSQDYFLMQAVMNNHCSPSINLAGRMRGGDAEITRYTFPEPNSEACLARLSASETWLAREN